MKTSKIIFSASRLSDGALEDQALAVAAALTGNTHFPEPSPSLTLFNDSIKAFSEALALASSRDRVKVAIKNDLRTELEFMLLKLCNYCTHVAEGDRTMLVSSGFPVKADSFVPRVLTTPENFTAQLGNHSGEITVSVNRVPGANAYLLLYQQASAENGAWTHATNTAPNFNLTGLQSLQSYNFRIGAIGSRGQTLYTDTMTKMVL